MSELDKTQDTNCTNRIAAFGAIRRAAAYARAMDEAADRAPIEYCYQFIDMAKGARTAIRAAIGPVKT
jgi:hypothetical protein